MTTQEKQLIREALAGYCSRIGTQEKAANTLKNVSGATVSRILSGELAVFKDEMFRNIANQIGYKSKNWVIVETTDFKIMTSILGDAQENALVMAITGEAGSGKSKAIEAYTEIHANVFALTCSEYWNRKLFLQALLRTMGIDTSGETVGDMVNEALKALKRAETPLLIFDEADKLSDQVLYFFITIYNELEDHCGIILSATDHLEKRIKRGLRLNKKGYKEIYSRVGRKFIKLNGATKNDVREICTANGIEDMATIRNIQDDCEGDLRRVRRRVHAEVRKRNNP